VGDILLIFDLRIVLPITSLRTLFNWWEGFYHFLDFLHILSDRFGASSVDAGASESRGRDPL